MEYNHIVINYNIINKTFRFFKYFPMIVQIILSYIDFNN